MKAIILAAGVGERMGAVAGGRPKCLLDIDGSSLLERHLAALSAGGVGDIALVTGFEAQAIAAALRAAGATVQLLPNADYRAGSIVSLWTARPALESGDDVLLMDADVLYHPEVLARLLRGPRRNCLLLDREFEAGEEPVKLRLLRGRVVEFRKRPDTRIAFDTEGESVGFFRFAPDTARRLAAIAGEYVAGGRHDEPYEEAIRALLLERPADFTVEDVTGLPWIELDFPADLARARAQVLPRIRELPN